MADEEYKDADFEWLANVYNGQSAINHPSELHGLMFGELSGGVRREGEAWVAMVMEHMGVDSLDTSRQTNLENDLIDFYQRTDDQVEQDSSAFTLLLPDDDYALTERLEALGLWVRGFLEGIALSAQGALSKVPEDLQEILRDFVEISQLDSRVQESEEGEREFFEVCEYVRIGVLNLYAEFNQLPEVEEGEESSQPTLH